jgi:hypothetical protein
MINITDLLETLMIVCFGLSWPISIRKSWISRTAKGKSLFFEVFIWGGYIFGIVRKFIQLSNATEPLGWLFYLAWAFYFVNFICISIDMLLYFRNTKLDKAREAE